MRKNKVIALILAVLLPGFGHIYLGLIKKGFIVFFLFILILFLESIIWMPILESIVSDTFPYDIFFILLSPTVWFYVWQIREVYLKATSYSDFDKRKVKIKR